MAFVWEASCKSYIQKMENRKQNVFFIFCLFFLLLPSQFFSLAISTEKKTQRLLLLFTNTQIALFLKTCSLPWILYFNHLSDTIVIDWCAYLLDTNVKFQLWFKQRRVFRSLLTVTKSCRIVTYKCESEEVIEAQNATMSKI